MKSNLPSTVVAVSLTVANLVWFLGHRENKVPVLFPTQKEATARANVSVPTESPSLRPLQTLTPSRPFHWSQLESSDYPTFIANLRAVGCPEATIRDLIKADIRSTFQKLKREIPATKSDRYWADGYGTESDDPRLQQLAAQEHKALEAMLGSSDDDAEDGHNPGLSLTDAPLGELLEGKRDELVQWQRQFEAVRQDVIQRSEQRELTESEKGWLAQLDQKQAKALEAILSPEEQEEYNLRFSSTAEDLRTHLAGTEVSESEFRSLVKLRQAYEQQIPSNSTLESNTLGDAWNQYLQGAKQLLGGDRFQKLHPEGS